jgi:hypothetical protein
MKTLIIFNELERISYSIVDGDYSHFHGVIFNSMMEHTFEKECNDFMFDENGQYKHKFSNDISLIEKKEWDKVALITFLL